MKVQKFIQNSAIGTAVLASLCCITPVLAVLGGIGGVASTFAFLEPLRPYLIALTAILLGYAFYNAYQPKRKDAIECGCEDEEKTTRKSLTHSKIFLWAAAGVTVVFITFPYYSPIFFPNAQTVSTGNSKHIVSATIEIEGMTCTSCEHSVDYALKSEKGVLTAKSSQKTGIAFVQYDADQVKPKQLKKAIENKVGYKVKNIQPTDKIKMK